MPGQGFGWDYYQGLTAGDPGKANKRRYKITTVNL